MPSVVVKSRTVPVRGADYRKNENTDRDESNLCDHIRSLRICSVSIKPHGRLGNHTAWGVVHVMCKSKRERWRGCRDCFHSVSYTHLDVYKRQMQYCLPSRGKFKYNFTHEDVTCINFTLSLIHI